ncbi:hypothetical protein A2331_00150 [Candidatus Falkowbacteria bacterium RIFOXYB2_FULL_34_18]|uniref:Peptidase S11 D-alanyl-D-alanine carboxypeptidase A N-terminal domain-containing protein n=1 Tax=Candidatus Falkowbacteria bacterium RIFOXYD2_FULL_34_120 TaxID=1798007 RepID=A0A1F5TSB1_9BACT|nr:MAG: hypothetical protein A2331_00150 [Candidatus Falkowbacteria bacterium RIFOXYB2_FULL_34_18]OGF29765.1 MAG: hypothetical protein A2500_01200 [Candidatus Falkowbacteria bacterium RIFOXYC12_FULL_34_55]OGF37506.1 MAG: hypothetical protein A2466_00710 [Candidatus Falkowbacteria bacterium RIFOXYC2_FULL_34_220]OGF39216.1 MAG: hypothetical protein A2515_01220 [Candidatus Falkowbacteria bacterium RIFOXYD12_FULL_34_57]OGF41783.1 MAG: hypothetical protein A2531_05880 [Candidatus Falkowbacteria bact
MKKIVFVVFFFLSFSVVRAADNEIYSINLDKETITKGYTVTAFDDELKLSLAPGILNESTNVEIVRLNEEMPSPWNLDRVSNIYQFEFKNKAAYDNHTPFYIQFAYSEQTGDYKKVFFYDKNYNTWRPLPTKDFSEEKFVRSLIHLPFARIAVFSYPKIMTSGRASWYAYKGGNFAASPDFPKGSKLRVHNQANGKFVDVIINDFGPERHIFPDRVIDLDKIAFLKISSLGEGVVDVRIEPLYIEKEDGRELGVPDFGVGVEPDISLKSAIIFEEESGKELWGKYSTSTLPLASLTKMIAVKVFLDTKPSLNREVAYSTMDAEYNYEHCKPWESSKINLKEGEMVTIEDLVYASLVGSANNTIETLVRVSGLSRASFIDKMNQTVLGWGASSTYFIEPTGLSPDNVSSARDYAIITKEVLVNPIIQKASTMDKYKFITVNTANSYRVSNTNKLIFKDLYQINGSKTGYLDEAGYCLMTRVESPLGNNLIVVTMGADSREASFTETERLIKYGLRLL